MVTGRALVGGTATSNFVESAICEERETTCMAATKGNRVKFAKDKCLNPFRDAKVAVKEWKLNWREGGEMNNLAPASNGRVMLNVIEEAQFESWTLGV